MNPINFKIKKTVSGDYKTPVTFYEYRDTSPYPDEVEERKLYFCLAEMYNLSAKDWEILNVSTSKTGMTIVIPDALEDYTPRTNHVVEVEETQEESKFTIDDVKRHAKEFLQKGDASDKKALKDKLTDLGAGKVSDLKPTQYEEVIEFFMDRLS